jgi:hypothetical protein
MTNENSRYAVFQQQFGQSRLHLMTQLVVELFSQSYNWSVSLLVNEFVNSQLFAYSVNKSACLLMEPPL